MVVRWRAGAQRGHLHLHLMIFMIRGFALCRPRRSTGRCPDTIGLLMPSHPQHSLRGLYADPPPFRTHRLEVGAGHLLSVRESGRPDGIAAVVLHGGPGSGCSPLQRRFFDPARYRIVCIDQRGAGESRPRGAIDNNTTAHLMHDLRRVREALAIQRWLVVGGSWGATLALAHALDDPHAVSALLLRAVFLARPEDIDAFFVGAAFSHDLAGADASTVLATLAQQLQHHDVATRRACALAWWRHEQRLSNPTPPPADAEPADIDAQVDRYRVQAHYMRHGCWVQSPPPLLERCAQLPPRPTLMLQGSEDRICPPSGASALHRVAPHALLQPVPGAGHDPSHPAMVDAMVRALNTYAAHGSFAAAAYATPGEAAR
jgi:proline iminopeptidase